MIIVARMRTGFKHFHVIGKVFLSEETPPSIDRLVTFELHNDGENMRNFIIFPLKCRRPSVIIHFILSARRAWERKPKNREMIPWIECTILPQDRPRCR